MRVLAVYAHPNPRSFCHAVLEQVTGGLRDGGHAVAVIDLHAAGFDPVFRDRDFNQFMHPTLPDELVEAPDLREAILERVGGPLRRRAVERWMRGKSNREIVAAVGRRTPKDIRRHQEAVARADGLVFIAPVYWMGFPAILKGWLERVFTYGFAYTLDARGWKGDLDGRVPLLTQERALVLTPTFFTEEEYDRGWRQAMDTVICDWGLTMAGVRETEHVYLYAVGAVDAATRAGYLDLSYRLGRDFALGRGSGTTAA